MGPLAQDSSPAVSQDVGQGSGLLGKLTLVVVGRIHFPAGHATWASMRQLTTGHQLAAIS